MAKYRHGFVSNSSSSSFVCDISGAVESGYDACYSDFEFCQCEKGHEFFYSDWPKVAEWIENGDDDGDGDEYSVPAELCPICTGEAKAQIVERLQNELKRLNITVADLA